MKRKKKNIQLKSWVRLIQFKVVKIRKINALYKQKKLEYIRKSMPKKWRIFKNLCRKSGIYSKIYAEISAYIQKYMPNRHNIQ